MARRKSIQASRCLLPEMGGRQRVVAAKATPAAQAGFTLVELIVVLIIIGVLAVVAIPRFSGRQMYDDKAFHDQVVSTLRYAQKSAIAQRQFVCVLFPANNSITLSYGPNNTCAGGVLASPTGTPYPLTSSRATFSSGAPAGLIFDCLGRLRDTGTAATCDDTNAVRTATRVLTITNITPGQDITIEPETGYVH